MDVAAPVNMDETLEPPTKNKIQTFVFLDTEATGLVGDDTRILELSLIAVSREDLLSMKDSQNQKVDSPKDEVNQTNGTKTFSAVPKLPRVLHKYTRLYYPRKLITPKLEEITGLSNDMLHHLPGFRDASAEALNLFLDLPQPVSLVAHNGSRYDFPLLKAELNNVSALEKFCDLQCVDTLTAIKDIDITQQRESERRDILEITELAESFGLEEMHDELMEVAPSSKRSRYEIKEEERSQAVNGTLESAPNQEANHPLLEVSPEVPITPVKDHIPGRGTKMPATPVKPKEPMELPITPEQQPRVYLPGTPGFSPQAGSSTKKVRRSLNYGENNKRKWDGTKPYTQSNIYKRLFGCTFEAHRAENDCQALLEICGHYGEKFVEWADTFYERFVEVKPMWVKRRTFHFS